jgi:hypothetical protein
LVIIITHEHDGHKNGGGTLVRMKEVGSLMSMAATRGGGAAATIKIEEGREQ